MTAAGAPDAPREGGGDFAALIEAMRMPRLLRPAIELAPVLSVLCDARGLRRTWLDFGIGFGEELLRMYRVGEKMELAHYQWLRRRHAGSEVGVFGSMPVHEFDAASLWERLATRGTVPASGDAGRRWAYGAMRDADLDLLGRADRAGHACVAAGPTPATLEDAVSLASDVAGMRLAAEFAADACRGYGVEVDTVLWVCGERGHRWPRPFGMWRALDLFRASIGGDAPVGAHPLACDFVRTVFDPAGRKARVTSSPPDPVATLAELGYVIMDVMPVERAVALWRPTLFETTYPYAAPKRRPRAALQEARR